MLIQIFKFLTVILSLQSNFSHSITIQLVNYLTLSYFLG